MVQWVFVTALTLVSALALALVYGLGGYLALNGRMAAGDVVALALLITRLYAPLTGLAGARVEVMSALVSFGRVFEILDLPPLIREPRAPAAAARRTAVGGAVARALRLPGGDGGVAGVVGGRRPARRPRRGRGAARRVLPGRAGADGGARRVVGRGQVDGRAAAAAALRRRLRRGADRRGGRARPVVRHDPRRARAGHAGRAPVPRVDPWQPAAGPPRGDRGRAVGRAAAGPAGGAGRRAAGRAGHRGRRAGVPALRR